MTKPWEETWFAESCARLTRADGPDPQWGDRRHVADVAEDSDERARLASAAPDMARVLLAIEWAGGRPEGPPECPSCRADEYEDVIVGPTTHDAAGRYIGYRKREHEPDCALDAALRKAGVR